MKSATGSILLLFLISVATAQQSQHNLVGVWKFDTHRSDFTSVPWKPPTSLTLTITSDSPASFQYHYIAHQVGGGIVHVVYNGAVDSNPHPISGLFNVKSVTYFPTDDPNVRRAAWKSKTGGVSDETITLSKDGRTMVVEAGIGPRTSVSVYRRVDSSQ